VSIDELVKLIDAATKLLGVLVWPALVAFVLIRFAPALKDFFSSLARGVFVQRRWLRGDRKTKTG
jgi:hypothetical protein